MNASQSPHPALRAEGVSLAYDRRVVVENLSVTIPRGKVTVIVGPNGCGKSTLLRGFARLLPPTRGTFFVEGERLAAMPLKESAKRLGLLPQQPIAPEGITVRDLVGRGRHPHQGLFRRFTDADRHAVGRALTETGTLELASRDVAELSGGQRQRVWIALALAQETPILLLDEPTTYLDLAHQMDVLSLVLKTQRERGGSVVMVLHDLNLAARFADHLIAMRGGRVVGEGRPEDVLTREAVREIFGLESTVTECPETGKPLVVPASTAAERTSHA
ncbi:ABC transporter ATP-binding protein [Falsarthrobacter nasiphocae]|uniref:Iron complex transport system ATP-binding protein n=1 Tax=Falsarthrobacter nasiphocae TaxID=189863 RepID=A0AAE4C6K2_9MICC|nr:ABC transporter ATP-binding protein [Falsarthrobacter nasiphocae]MDR6892252.1 iron complex transport system ATP-binding protein [Falsarthrobacter nasiphocae]